MEVIMNLECSSAGDKRFSACYAAINWFGKRQTIEKIYQSSKRFAVNKDVFIPKTIKDAKGKKPSHFVVNGQMFSTKHLTSFYQMLWAAYFKENPRLLDYIRQFDTFSDKFKGKSVNCQADVIALIAQDGIKKVIDLCEPFKAAFSKEHVVIRNGDIFDSHVDIIAQQVNCLGVMGAGLALEIKNRYSTVYDKYCDVYDVYNNKEELLGKCQIVSSSANGRIIANLFGQYGVNRNKQQTQVDKLETALIKLKNYAKQKQLSVGIPYGIGCGLGGGNWNDVLKIINNVFSNYFVYLYKKQ